MSYNRDKQRLIIAYVINIWVFCMFILLMIVVSFIFDRRAGETPNNNIRLLNKFKTPRETCCTRQFQLEIEKDRSSRPSWCWYSYYTISVLIANAETARACTCLSNHLKMQIAARTSWPKNFTVSLILKGFICLLRCRPTLLATLLMSRYDTFVPGPENH